MSAAATYTWAKYFGITFIIALAFGLLVPILILVAIVVICRRRHAYRHHHCMTNGSGGSSYGNSKLFSANLWHYIGGKEVADDPFEEHTASMHRSPFSAHIFPDGTMGMLGTGTLDLPDVVIPSGRMVGGTLMRQTPQAFFNGAPHGYQTMATSGKAMYRNDMSNSMLASQPNFTMGLGVQGVIPNVLQQGNPQMMMPITDTTASGQLTGQPNAAQQPANYFQSLAHPATSVTNSGSQPVMVTVSAAPVPVVTAAVAMATAAAPTDDNGPFVLPDPPSDHHQDRDQVAAALDALNAATEPPHPLQPSSTTPAVSGEHPPPGYDEAVGMVVSGPAAAPVLPPRRTAPDNDFTAPSEPLSLAQRYGLLVAEI